MDFFEHQAQAKIESRRLVWLFLLLCSAVTLAVNGVIYTAFLLHASYTLPPFIEWQLSLPGLYASLLSVCIIGFGCLRRWLELRKGGNGLAISLGARSLGFGSEDENEKRLINVCEEMAIAAGITTPGIYVLDSEPGLNAFIIGYELQDCALVVTHGLLHSLNRDELQGVVAHEMSHILHGDNQINIRLLVMLAGMLWVAELGSHLSGSRRGFRRGSYRHSYSSHSSDLRNKGHIISLPLILAGYLGLFLGKILRSAISRKREYLADASSVQFTRNPNGLASALHTIKEHTHGSNLRTSRAEELSHLCIAMPKKPTWFANAFKTHPPLDDRINRIDPTFSTRKKVQKQQQKRQTIKQEKTAATQQAVSSIYAADTARMQLDSHHHLHDIVGSFNADALVYAMALHEDMPHEYKRSLHDQSEASLMVLYLLLNEDTKTKKIQIMWLQREIKDSKLFFDNLTLMSQGLEQRFKLPLLELLLPVLKTLNTEKQQTLLGQALKLVKWDKQLHLTEIGIYSLLKSAFETKPSVRSSYEIKKLSLVKYEINVLISALIHATGSNEQNKVMLHERTMAVLMIKTKPLLHENEVEAETVYKTLKKLKQLSPFLKRSLLDVCSDVIKDDGIVMAEEYELLRLICLQLGCPVPLLVK